MSESDAVKEGVATGILTAMEGAVESQAVAAERLLGALAESGTGRIAVTLLNGEAALITGAVGIAEAKINSECVGDSSRMLSKRELEKDTEQVQQRR